MELARLATACEQTQRSDYRELAVLSDGTCMESLTQHELSCPCGTQWTGAGSLLAACHFLEVTCLAALQGPVR
jgi:hypothetical protein